VFAGRVIIALFLLAAWSCAGAGQTDVFVLRNQNPFLQVFGMPQFRTAATVPAGEFRYQLVLSVVNNAEQRQLPSESIVIDGQTDIIDLAASWGISRWLELGVLMPLVHHSGGFLDGPIKRWHNLWGLSNSKREGPPDQLNYYYARDGVTLAAITSSSFGIGDVQLTAAVPVSGPAADGGSLVTLRFSVKLPTGDSQNLHGSGAVDVAAGAYADSSSEFLGRALGFSGFAGILVLGKGDFAPEIQRDTVPFAGAALSWQATERLAITGQAQVQGVYFDSAQDDLGGSSIQLAFGGTFRPRRGGLALGLAIVEDLIGDTTPDLALHFSIRTTGGR